MPLIMKHLYKHSIKKWQRIVFYFELYDTRGLVDGNQIKKRAHILWGKDCAFCRDASKRNKDRFRRGRVCLIKKSICNCVHSNGLVNRGEESKEVANDILKMLKGEYEILKEEEILV